MGKRIISQRRGSGTPRYVTPSFRFKGSAKHRPLSQAVVKGRVNGIIHSPAHSSPLVIIEYSDNKEALTIAPEGIRIGDMVTYNGEELERGNIAALRQIPEGTLVHNIERNPGDGGKFVRSSGTTAKVVSKTPTGVGILMPSKKVIIFHPECRASIGVVAGGGRPEKPFLKAGNLYYKKRAKNRLYPSVSGHSMNAVDHPFGNKRGSRKSKARPTSWNAPPGRKVGSVRARRTGRKKK